MRTYYIIVSAGLSMFAKYRGRYPMVSSRKPEDHELGRGDRVYTIRGRSIEGVRNLVGLNRSLRNIGAAFLFEM